MRNAENDLKICDAATPGPWKKVNKNGGCAISEKTFNVFKTLKHADIEFIAPARESLPYRIKRAQTIENALIYVCKMLEESTGSCPVPNEAEKRVNKRAEEGSKNL